MKRVYLILMLFILMAKLGLSQPDKPGSWWAVMAEGNIHCSDKYTIFTAAENKKIESNSEYRCVLPGPKLLSIGEIYLIDSTTINLFIKVNTPRKHNVVEFLKNDTRKNSAKGNKEIQYINVGHIRPFPIVGYQIKFRNKVLYSEDAQIGIDEISYVRLECPDAPQVIELLKSGKEVITLKVDYWEKFKLTNICKISTDQVDTMKFVRNLFSPVNNNTITAIQRGIASRVISSKLIADCENIGPVDESAQPIRKILFEQVSAYMNAALESLGRQVLIPFDFSEERYASDFDTRLAYDAKNMSKEQFRSKNHEEIRDRLRKEIVKEGGGGIGILEGLLNLSGKGKKGVREAIETHEILSKDDAWQNIIKDSFKYEWEGGKYYPKSIIAYEDLSNLVKIDFDFNYRSSSYGQSTEYKIFHIRAKAD